MDFNLNRGPIPQLPPQAHLLLMVPGVAFIAIGVFLIYNPHLIPYFLGGILILLGALLVFLARRMQRFISR